MRLGEMLIRAGVISDLQLNAALAEQQRWGGRLGQILVRMGVLNEDLLVLALCRQLALPKAELDGITAIPEVLRERIDQAACERYHVLPLAYVQERKAIQLAMSDPFDVVALDDLSRMLGTKIEAFLAGDQALAAAIRRLYGSANTTSLTTNAGVLDLMDNGGNARSGAPAPATTQPPYTQPPYTPPPYTPPPQQQAPQQAMGQASFAARLDEHQRAVRAVAELLAERGYVPWVFRA